jgi:hypothetical protein
MNTQRGRWFNMAKIYPVLLAGGSGTRLWPLSRKSYPKQFSNLIGENTLFQSSAQRLTSSKTLDFTYDFDRSADWGLPWRG